MVVYRYLGRLAGNFNYRSPNSVKNAPLFYAKRFKGPQSFTRRRARGALSVWRGTGLPTYGDAARAGERDKGSGFPALESRCKEPVGGVLVLLLANWVVGIASRRRALRALPADFVHDSV